MSRNIPLTHAVIEELCLKPNDFVFVWETPLELFNSVYELNDTLERWYEQMNPGDKVKFKRPKYRGVYRNPSRESWVVATVYDTNEELDVFLLDRLRVANEYQIDGRNWVVNFRCIMAGDQYGLECKYIRNSIEMLETQYDLCEEHGLMSIRSKLHRIAKARPTVKPIDDN